MEPPNPIGKDLDKNYNSIRRSVQLGNSESVLIIQDLLFGAYADMLTIESRLAEIAAYAEASGFMVTAGSNGQK